MKSLEELREIRERTLKKMALRKETEGTRIVVGMATCGIAAGARPVLTTLLEEVDKRGLDGVVVGQTGCIGMCKFEPIVEVYKPGEEKVTYVHVDPEKARRIIAEHIVNGRVVKEFTIGAYE